jgi:hypothetical protein
MLISSNRGASIRAERTGWLEQTLDTASTNVVERCS